MNQLYWTCNVSTCTRKRTGLVFCSVECWDAHVPMANHRESWAIENRSPKVLEAGFDSENERQGSDSSSLTSAQQRDGAARSKKPMSERERFVASMGLEESVREQMIEKEQMIEQKEENRSMSEGNEKEVLIVASKLKNYIRAKSGMNTSAAVTDVLSDKVRELCDQAVENAKRDGRKTVMDRDFL